MNEHKICPYPGLRPFTEDESIYFKGREEHIEKIIAQLEEKKFVMLTGASGDGKSSIVYAGVIPNARAGFFKAKFNSWLITDFRPERSPLKNMAIALSEKLGYNDVAFVEKELGFGFSSLIKLYKNSKFYLDQKSDLFLNADDKEKKTLKRKAANLFILVDQFEEFFTNAENYHNGKTSVQSQAVLNLLLETAKIALAEDLPIYIICTMRSDYIGQCAAFRGLPEYIGFSQFFVPRLKRKEIHQVIEEPAILSGNKISNRLTETLINEIGEGFDQLPVLQHALNQIWTQADRGNEEMDLIHLAKLSGLPNNYLPENDKQKFSDWFKTIPEFKKAFFKTPSLESVLNAHANELYETACDNYNAKHEQKINKESAHHIIKVVFQCLTKIDDARAVRNRMTLEELTNVINDTEISSEMVGGVLDYFRLQGNTFLKPFIISEETSGKLNNDDVLDITHESLIRNWDLLTEWAKEEHENLLNFLDFDKQLQRWLRNNKDKGYLLPIGPLTFFETWYNTCKPNKYWLARYDESEDSREQKLSKAEKTLKLADEFLKKSARSLFFSRYVLKHGANKLVAYVGIIVLVLSCSFYYYDYTLKQNDNVIESLEDRGIELLSSNKVTTYNKADFIIKYERLNPGVFAKILNKLDNDTLAFDIAGIMFEQVQNFEKKEKNEEIHELVYPLLNYLDGRLENLTNRQRVSFKISKTYNLERFNKFLSYCAYVKSHTNDDTTNILIDKNTWILNAVLHNLLDQSADSTQVNVIKFNNSIQLLLALAPKSNFDYYIKKLSPIEGSEETKKRFAKLYPAKEKTTLSHNGGYQILGQLYAADTNTNTSKIIQCLDSIIHYNHSYGYNYDYYSIYSILNTLSYYDKYSNENADILLKKVMKDASGYFDIIKIMDRLTNDNFCKKIDFGRITEMYSGSNYYAKYFCTKTQRQKVWDHQYKVLNELRNKKYTFDQREINDLNGLTNTTTYNENFDESSYNFAMALFYKKKGSYEEEIFNDITSSHENFKKAFEHYNLITPENQKFYALGAMYQKLWEPEKVKMSFAFLYPMVMCEPVKISYYERGTNTFTNRYGTMPEQSQSTEFFKYILQNDLTKNFETKEGIEILERYCYANFDDDTSKNNTSFLVLDLMNDILAKKPELKGDMYDEYILIHFINKAFDSGDTTLAFNLFSKLSIEKMKKTGFLDAYQKKEYRAQTHPYMLNSLAKHLAINGRLKESFDLINLKQKDASKRNILTDIAYDLQEKGPVENTFYYLDTIFKNNDLDGQPKFGMKLIQTMAMVGSKEMFTLCKRMMKDLPELVKPRATLSFIRGVAYNGYYYEASNYIPENVSSNKELQLIGEILQVENRKREFQKQKSANVKTKLKPAYEFSGLDYEGADGQIRFDSLD